MTLSDPYEAKRALFVLLAANTGTGQPLDGIQVAYAYPGNPAMKCIYGGGVRFDHTDAVAEGVGVLVEETVSVGVYIRVVSRPAIPVEDNDAIAASIGQALLALLKTSTVVGAGRWTGLSRASGVPGGDGLATYERTDDETVSTLGYHFQFGRMVSY